MRTVLVTVVFENLAEITPPNLSFVPRVPITFQHRLHVQVLDKNGIVRRRVEVREFMLVIALFIRHASVNLGNTSPLFLPVARLVLFARERALLAFEALAFIGQVETVDRPSVGVVDEVEHAEVETHCVLCIDFFYVWFLWIVCADAERDVPGSCGFFFHRDFLDSVVLWEVAVQADWNIYGLTADFFESEYCSVSWATLLVEFEA